MPETRTIALPVYRTPTGEPTCAWDFKTGEVCELLRIIGLREVCALSVDPPERARLRRRTSSTGEKEGGGLIPGPDCLLWREKT
jgi:hypothetical protein